MSKYCRHCGAELNPGVKFCSECGQEVGTAGEDRTRQESEQWDDQEHDEWGGGDSGGWTEQPDTQRGGYQEEQGGDTTLAAVTHVLALFTWILGPVIIYAVTDDPFVKENAANATNWQIMFSIYMLIAFVLIFVVIGILFIFLLPLLDLAFCIIAAVKASDGEAWSYPITPDLL